MADEKNNQQPETVAIKPGARPTIDLRAAHKKRDEEENAKAHRVLDKRAEDLKRGFNRLHQKEAELEERKKGLDVREKVITGIENNTPKFGKEATACIMLTAAQGLLLVEPIDPKRDSGLQPEDVPEEFQKILTGTPAATARTLALIRAFLNAQIINAERAGNAKARAEAVTTLTAFETTLHERGVEDKEAERQAKAAAPAPKPGLTSTLADTQRVKAKEKDRAKKKAERGRNTPATVEAPAPTPAEPPTTPSV